ncbi:hypothetical protein ADICYQ_3143 [Cyclobacterium qasimii M12-11B]|uniref:Uncharacterized protein n=1 Tax=Cyclobacterium qasimii M12-11B TaxID=641524 RepID=S7VDX4_9BACT|nr:hypothetical protein ADICYQ_3143 [Cyclobacterium qasimii M12-11B]
MVPFIDFLLKRTINGDCFPKYSCFGYLTFLKFELVIGRG